MLFLRATNDPWGDLRRADAEKPGLNGHPVADADSFERAMRRLQAAGADGRMTIFEAGDFDLPTDADGEAAFRSARFMLNVGRDADWTSVQSDISGAVVGEYTLGACHVFAVALHERTGWPIIGVLDATPRSDDPGELPYEDGNGNGLPDVRHLFVRAPDGDAIDASGKASVEEVVGLYGGEADTDMLSVVELDLDEVHRLAEGPLDPIRKEQTARALRLVDMGFALDDEAREAIEAEAAATPKA